ncbi:MAG: polyphosphate kinase 2 family protein [Bacteroidales bacterium]|nr:polyphosphate kinase 2 family protein [Bacteroidales bacterium]
MDKLKDIMARPGEFDSLADFKTSMGKSLPDKKELKEQLKNNITLLKELQNKLYASNKYSLLLIFQAMDAAGKDGTIKHVMSGINPQGCQVYSFKQPSENELEHDFLWRTTVKLPNRGNIGIFNRSYYEEVLIVKVHPEIVLHQRIPGIEKMEHISKKFWNERYESIKDFEKHMFRNGTHIVKFFLHVSKEEQKKRFMERIENKDKNWKYTISDIEERKYWNNYQSAYEEMIKNTTTTQAPWYIIPADKKWYMRYLVSQVLIHSLEKMNLYYPEVGEKQLEYIQKGRQILEQE